MNKLVCLKYVEGLTSKTEVVPVPNIVHFDHDSKLWWVTGAHFWVRTPIGGHLLFQEKEGIRCIINLGKPGAVIGIYDEFDPKQVKAIRKDAKLAVKKEEQKPQPQ